MVQAIFKAYKNIKPKFNSDKDHARNCNTTKNFTSKTQWA